MYVDIEDVGIELDTIPNQPGIGNGLQCQSYCLDVHIIDPSYLPISTALPNPSYNCRGRRRDRRSLGKRNAELGKRSAGAGLAEASGLGRTRRGRRRAWGARREGGVELGAHMQREASGNSTAATRELDPGHGGARPWAWMCLHNCSRMRRKKGRRIHRKKGEEGGVGCEAAGC